MQRDGVEQFVETGDFAMMPPTQSISAMRDELTSKSTRTVDKLTIELVGMLFDHVMQDKQVPAEIKARLSRLQFPVLKAALMDAAFFASSAHPARKLIDRIAGTSAGWEPYGDDNQKYLKEVDRVIGEILKNFETDLAVFEKVYTEFDRFVSEIDPEDSDPVSRAKKALEAAEKHEILTINTTIQVRRAFERVDLEPYIKEFLLGPWVKVLVAATVRSETQPGFAKSFRDVIHELVWSVQPKASTEDRNKLVKMIPGMVRVLRDGLALINSPERDRDQFFTQLMESHAMAVKPVDQATYIKSSLLTSELRAKIDGMQLSGMFPVTTVPGGIRVSTGLIMRAAQEHHADIQMPDPLTDIARLDPVEDARVQEEIGRWQRGNWFKMWNGMEFVRVKLRWMSPLRTLFLFAGEHDQKAHVLSSDMLKSYLARKYIEPLESVPLTKRAVDAVVADFESAPDRATNMAEALQGLAAGGMRPPHESQGWCRGVEGCCRFVDQGPACATPVPSGRVTGGYVLKQLVADGMLATSDAERFKISGGRDRAGHPLVNLAEMNYRTPNAERKLLDLETLTQWLAQKASLPYFHIDPLRVDFTRVVDVMSSSYATTYSILPVAMSGDEVTIATCEPFQTGWEREIEQITKKTVKRVVSNPLDVARYTTEFYKLAQQVRGAAKSGAAPLVSSFEQLVELGGKVEANDAHVIHIVDWLLQYAFDQRASDIHLEPRREFGVARFRIDGVLHQVYQVPAG